MSVKYQKQCERKWRHENYLTAMQHARQLSDPNIVIYPCGYCGGLHIGHARIRYVAHRKKEQRDRIRSLLRKIKRHRHLLKEEQERLNTLRKELRLVLIEY